MEPLDDKELNQLLSRWQAPDAPASLRRRVLKESRWRWLLTGTIRVPVPFGVAAVVLIALWMYFSIPVETPEPAQATGSSLADFQAVEQLEPRIVREER